MSPTQSDWSQRRVLVTGATGLVGSWLCRRLVDANAYVVALVRDINPQTELYRSGTVNRLNVVNGALEDYAAVERSINEHDVDTIIHLGAQTIVGTAQRSPRTTLEANVQGTWNVLDAARVHSSLVKRVVVASSDKAYGTQPVLPYTEDMSLIGRAPYEVSKSCTDLVTASYAHTYGVRAAIARCGNIFGGGDLNWSRIVPGTLRSLYNDETPIIRSDGTFLRDYVFVDDVVDAYLVLADALDDDANVGEGYNFSDERPLSVLDVYSAVCEAAGKRVEPQILGGAKDEIKDQYLDSSKARDRLGWKAQFGLEEGLQRTAGWYRQYFDDHATSSRTQGASG